MTAPRFAPPTGFRGVFRDDDDARGVYAESAGVPRVLPRSVAVPVDVEDVVTLVRWAATARIPIIPRGSGSSMSGAAVGEGVIVDLSRLNHIGAVDVAQRTVRVGAGATRATVERAANELGLRLAVDPSSGAFATIGGMASTNAAGPHTLAYGSMRQWVRSVECVLADGSLARVTRDESVGGGAARGETVSDESARGVPILARWAVGAPAIRGRAAALELPAVRKQSSGYGVHAFADDGELLSLLVGSEGTLVLLTEVELELIPLPEATASVLAAWGSIDDAVHGASLARSHGAAACELLDRTFLDVAAQGRALPVPASAESVLLVEFEGAADVGADASVGANVSMRASALASAFARACETAGATGVLLGLDAESEEALWGLRHAASPILSRLDANLKSMQVIEDGCVPPDQLGDYVRGVRAALDRAEMRGVIFGHAGDAHVHVNALVDVRDPTWRERLRALAHDVVSLTASLGGTLAGEHGDGRLRTPWLTHTWSAEALALFGDIKQVFDPAGILNPGVKVPAALHQAIGATSSGAAAADDVLAGNKYDAAQPPLTERARQVLDRVERERAYDRSRLEMLDEGA